MSLIITLIVLYGPGLVDSFLMRPKLSFRAARGVDKTRRVAIKLCAHGIGHGGCAKSFVSCFCVALKRDLAINWAAYTGAF
jgi:hypothetical protein